MVTRELHAPAALRSGKEPQYPLDRMVGGPYPVWTVEGEKAICL
jgi:hypothetical protein